jgi:hypothetical protein
MVIDPSLLNDGAFVGVVRSIRSGVDEDDDDDDEEEEEEEKDDDGGLSSMRSFLSITGVVRRRNG